MLSPPFKLPPLSSSSSPTTPINPEAHPVTLSNPSTSSSPSSSSDPQPKPRRNYIQRKKCLNNSVNQIVNVLNFIQVLQKDSISPIEKQKVAFAHAQKIEAACWSPHSKLTPESYEKLISAKTAELCRVLLKKSIPQMDSNKIQQLKQQLFSKNPMLSLALNSSNCDLNIINNTNDNSATSKDKNEHEQIVLPEFSNSQTSVKTGSLIIDDSNSVNLTIFNSPSTNLSSNDSFSTLMLNETISAPIFPEINNNRISINPLKEIESTLLMPEQPPLINSLSEFDPNDDNHQEFPIDQLLINQNIQPADTFMPWTQKDQDIFRPFML